MLIFGTSKISGIGKSLGSAIRDFRNSVKGESPEDEEAIKEEPKEVGNSHE